MYKNFNLTEEERKQILGQHQSKGYRQPLKESTLENAVDEIGLTPDEIDALTSSLIDMGKSEFKSKVADIASDDLPSSPTDGEYGGEFGMMEGDGEMSEKEFKLRSAIDKIINKAGVISTLGIVPAAMFAGGGAGVAAGVTALAMLLLKDAAWWKRGHEMHKEMGTARKGIENMGVGDFLMGKKRDVEEQAQLNAQGMVKTGGNPAALNQANARINQIASVIASVKLVQKPTYVINNPASKLNGMAWDKYVATYKVTPQEIKAAQTINKSKGRTSFAPGDASAAQSALDAKKAAAAGPGATRTAAAAAAPTKASTTSPAPTATSRPPAPGTTATTPPTPGPTQQPISELGEGGFWRDVFGEPDIKDSARSAYKSQGYSQMGRDDEERKGEFYMVFNGQKYFPDQIDYADYNDMGDLPRVEGDKLIVPNPAWQS